mgnify:CR=1 FL=1
MVAVMFKKFGGLLLVGVSILWWMLNKFAEVITLWPDLREFWSKHMSSDPWMPWMLLFFGLAVFSWTYWPAYRTFFMKGYGMNDDGIKSLNQSVNIGKVTGGTVSPVYNNFQTTVAPGRVELSEAGVRELVNRLGGRTVNVDVVGDSRCQDIGQKLLAQLSAGGVKFSHVRTIGMKIPPPSNPYWLQLSDDGKEAYLIVSPATLP